MLRSLNASTTLPSSKLPGSPTLTLFGGSERTFGNRKRALPSVQPAMVAENAAQATANGDVIQRTRKFRRSSPFLAGVAGLAGIGGLAAAGAPGLAAAAGLAGDGGGAGVGFGSSDIMSEPSRAAPNRGAAQV